MPVHTCRWGLLEGCSVPMQPSCVRTNTAREVRYIGRTERASKGVLSASYLSVVSQAVDVSANAKRVLQGLRSGPCVSCVLA